MTERTYENLSMDAGHPHPRQPRCPVCRKPVVTDMMLGDATDEQRRFQMPTPDDFSVCAHCATVLHFYEDMDGTLQLRRATMSELAALPEGNTVWRAQAAVRLAIARTGKRN